MYFDGAQCGDMSAHSRIDITFDFRSDTPGYPRTDPDALSPTLRRYHQWLWSKPLPNGLVFELSDTTPGVYLHHRSQAGEFWLASDAVVPTFRKERRLAQIFERGPEDLTEFMRLGYTIGGMMLFPGNRVGRKMTINGARGFHPRIKDRFDLTLECIRRHYCRGQSPLSAALQRYADFFALFGDFPGYVEFFLLQDLVTDDYSAVRLFTPFQDFTTSPVPSTPEDYGRYRQRAMEFLEARNCRILRSC